MSKLVNRQASLSDDRERSINDLSRISGIAARTAEAMYDMGIRSYSDLIQYLEAHTAQEFSATLKEHGVNRRLGLIDRELWIKQAERLERSETGVGPEYRWEGQAEKSLKASQPGYKETKHDAMFTVSFDSTTNEVGERVLFTTVYNESNGGEEFVFQGMDTSAWVNWILERAGLPVVKTPGALESKTSQDGFPGDIKAPTPPFPNELRDLRLEIEDVQVSVVNPKLTTSEAQLRAVVRIKLFGADAERLTRQPTAFRIGVYMLNLDDGFPAQIGACEDQLEPHVFEYSQPFEVAMPSVGRYELHSTVHLLPFGELKAYYQGPVLRITP